MQFPISERIYQKSCKINCIICTKNQQKFNNEKELTLFTTSAGTFG